MYKNIKIHQENKIVEIILNRPERMNAITVDLLNELKKAVMKNGQSVDDNLVALIAKIGEKITIGKSKTIENTNGINNHYLHTVVKDNVAKLAVLVSLDTNDKSDTVKSFGKQLSMHIAASNPLALESNLIAVSYTHLTLPTKA